MTEENEAWTESVIVREDGSIILPQRVRDKLGLRPGMYVRFRQTSDNSFAIERADEEDVGNAPADAS